MLTNQIPLITAPVVLDDACAGDHPVTLGAAGMGSYLGAALVVYYVSRRTYNLYQSTCVSGLKGLRHLVGGNIGPGYSQFHLNLHSFFDPNHSFNWELNWEPCCHLTACFSICCNSLYS